MGFGKWLHFLVFLVFLISFALGVWTMMLMMMMMEQIMVKKKSESGKRVEIFVCRELNDKQFHIYCLFHMLSSYYIKFVLKRNRIIIDI